MEKGERALSRRVPIRLIGLDLDGTVLNSRKQITPRTRRAIELACAAGVAVVPATGRLKTGIPQELLSIPGVRYAVTANGAAVLDLHTSGSVFSGCLTREEAMWQYCTAQQWDVLFDVYVGQVIATERACFARLTEFAPTDMAEYFMKTRTCVESLHDFISAGTQPMEKVTMLFRDMNEREMAWRVLDDGGRFLVTSSLANNLEVNAKGIDKAAGLLALARHLGLCADEMMVCGDSSNDIAMLKAAGLAVVMQNAAPEIQKLADYVTDSNDEDGVAKAIERFVLHTEP